MKRLLDPSVIYVKFVSALQRAGVPIHYAVHVTGHGWRKLMRLVEPFVYRIRVVREPQPVFRFIQRHGPVDEPRSVRHVQYGVGFAVYVDPGDVPARWNWPRRTATTPGWLVRCVSRVTARRWRLSR